MEVGQITESKMETLRSAIETAKLAEVEVDDLNDLYGMLEHNQTAVHRFIKGVLTMDQYGYAPADGMSLDQQ